MFTLTVKSWDLENRSFIDRVFFIERLSLALIPYQKVHVNCYSTCKIVLYVTENLSQYFTHTYIINKVNMLTVKSWDT